MINGGSDRRRRARGLSGVGSLSLGAWIILLLAAGSSILVMRRPVATRHGLEMWTRARNHFLIYNPMVAQWNAAGASHEPVQLYLISDQALERRMMSGFLSQTHVADLIEIERTTAGRVFSGPLEDVGFVDLTERLHREGIYQQLNEPSYGPWTSRGRIFGLPHDVHPVLLAYRADLVEEAGIDITRIETWREFARVMKPMVRDLDGDGEPDRYPLNLWHTNMDLVELLVLQAGGHYFDLRGQPTLDTDTIAMVATHIVSWVCGPDRIAADAPEFNAGGNHMKIEGFVVCSFMPDWLGGVWRQDLPPLAGKIKLMPLPAWTKGGRRTSVWGGSMLGIARTTANFEDAWAFAKYLYLSRPLAEQLYATTGIISPVKRFWSSSFYDQPSPFFSGQSPGRLYIEAAPSVPRRTSSPFNMLAKAGVRDVLVELRRYAVAHEMYQPEALLRQAHQLLAHAETQLRRQMERNVFLREDRR